MRFAILLSIALLPIAAARAQTLLPVPPATEPTIALQEAARRFPALILGENVRAAPAGTAIPPACPPAGSRVEQKGGPTIDFLGVADNDPELCRMRVGADLGNAWFGIWGDDWAGGELAHAALHTIIHAETGALIGFDTIAAPGVAQWHELIRNDGVEDLPILGRTYRALKLAHYREGYGGNTYRSVATLWVDLQSGLPLFATYQHIAGKPELDSPMIPTAIYPAP